MASRILFTVMGVPFTANAESWQFVPPKLFIGVVVALIVLIELSFVERVVVGLMFGFVLLIVLLLHIVGHVVASKLVSPR